MHHQFWSPTSTAWGKVRFYAEGAERSDVGIHGLGPVATRPSVEPLDEWTEWTGLGGGSGAEAGA